MWAGRGWIIIAQSKANYLSCTAPSLESTPIKIWPGVHCRGVSAHALNLLKRKINRMRIRYTAWFVGKQQRARDGYRWIFILQVLVFSLHCSVPQRMPFLRSYREAQQNHRGVPITLDDGLSHHICRLCNRKFLSAESFIVLAKASYEKRRALPPRPLTS